MSFHSFCSVVMQKCPKKNKYFKFNTHPLNEHQIHTGDFQIRSTTAIKDSIKSGAYSNLTYMSPGGAIPLIFRYFLSCFFV